MHVSAVCMFYREAVLESICRCNMAVSNIQYVFHLQCSMFSIAIYIYIYFDSFHQKHHQNKTLENYVKCVLFCGDHVLVGVTAVSNCELGEKRAQAWSMRIIGVFLKSFDRLKLTRHNRTTLMSVGCLKDHPFFYFDNLTTLLETNISLTKSLLKMISLFQTWDMLVP